MLHSKLPNNLYSSFSFRQSIHDSNWFKTKLIFILRNINQIVESWKKNWKNPQNCSKIAIKSLFFPLFGKKSFLNQTLGVRHSFLNQTTYVLKNRLYPQSFLNWDSFLNQAFLNRDSTVFATVLFYLGSLT